MIATITKFAWESTEKIPEKIKVCTCMPTVSISAECVVCILIELLIQFSNRRLVSFHSTFQHINLHTIPRRIGQQICLRRMSQRKYKIEAIFLVMWVYTFILLTCIASSFCSRMEPTTYEPTAEPTTYEPTPGPPP